MLKVGLTGGLGSGKSTASKFFESMGAYILDADEAAKNEFITDSTILTEFKRRNAVNRSNNITKQLISDAEI